MRPRGRNIKRGAALLGCCTCNMKVDTHKKWVSTFFVPVKIRVGGGINVGSKKGIPHRKWTKEEKLSIIKLHLEDHKSLMQIEKEYSVSNGLVSTWVKKYLNGGEEALVSRSGNPYAALHTSKSLSEVERLRLIVAKQEIEIARLKKGYWVEGVGANRVYATGSAENTKSSKSSK